MKKSFKLSALVVLFSAGILTANAKDISAKTKVADQVSISGINNRIKLAVNILKGAPGRSTVAIYDNKQNLIMKDYLAGSVDAGKIYNLRELENGNYTITVASDNNTVTKAIHIYEDGGKKTFFFFAD